jgi:fatty acid desaturase
MDFTVADVKAEKETDWRRTVGIIAAFLVLIFGASGIEELQLSWWWLVPVLVTSIVCIVLPRVMLKGAGIKSTADARASKLEALSLPMQASIKAEEEADNKRLWLGFAACVVLTVGSIGIAEYELSLWWLVPVFVIVIACFVLPFVMTNNKKE